MSKRSKSRAKARRSAARAERFEAEEAVNRRMAKALRQFMAEANSVYSLAKARADRSVLGARTPQQLGWHRTPRCLTTVLGGSSAENMVPVGLAPQQGAGWSERDIRRAERLCENHDPGRTMYRAERRGILRRDVDGSPVYGTVEPDNRRTHSRSARVREVQRPTAGSVPVNPAEYAARTPRATVAAERAAAIRRKKEE